MRSFQEGDDQVVIFTEEALAINEVHVTLAAKLKHPNPPRTPLVQMNGSVRIFVCKALRLVHGDGRSALATNRPTVAVVKSVSAS
jgi:hypothetical protein